MKSTTLLAHDLLLRSALSQPSRATAQIVSRLSVAATYQPYQATDLHGRISGELQLLHQRWAATAGRLAASPSALRSAFPQLQASANGRTVLVHITTQYVLALTRELVGRGFVVQSSHPERHFVEGYLPLAQLAPGAAGLKALAGHGLLGVLPVERGHTNGDAAAGVARRVARSTGSSSLGGPVIGQGARLLQAQRVQALSGYDGRGRRIWVVSDSFDKLGTAAISIAIGNIPAEGCRC